MHAATFATFAALLCAIGAGSVAAADTKFPTRPIRMIVASSAGTGADIFARIVAQGLTDLYKEQVVVENRTGAGGLIGGVTAANATPDGHSLFMASTSTYVSPLMQVKPSYQPTQDFTAVAQVTAVTSVVLVNAGMPVKSVKELVALAKAKPGALNYGSVGAGTAAHLSAEIFKRAAGLDVVHIPFKTVADMYTEVASGRVHMLVFVLTSSLGFLKDGKLRGLAVTSHTRSFTLPELPTVAEAGLPGAESETMYGFLAPSKTPRIMVNKLGADIVTVLRKPDTKDRFEKLGAQPMVDTSPGAFEKYVRREYANFQKLIPEIGLKPQ
ncbi:MAG: tripartite tricarboxylate transporter substrate-binding protein [Burkholderiales bacterium]